MIEKMTGYSFILLSAEKEKFLEQLRELGVVDITRSAVPVDDRSRELLDSIEEKKARMKAVKGGIDPALDALKAEIAALGSELRDIEVWGEYDREKLAAIGTPVHFYKARAKEFDPAWEEEFPIGIIERDGANVWFVMLGEQRLPIREIPAPQRTAAEVRALLEEKGKELESLSEVVEKRKEDIPAIEKEIRESTDELGLYLAKVSGDDAADGAIVVYSGFAPTAGDAQLQKSLDGMDCYWCAQAATVQDAPPIEFRNNRFVKMFEPLTDMYGRPAYDGFDPTPFISIFFLLFFSMCMGDAGYGLILIIVGLLLRKVRSFASFAPLVTTLGIGTVVVGFFFHTFFSVDITGWFPPAVQKIMVPAQVAGYDGTMVLALIVGIVHLCLAMIVKTVYATRNKGFLGSLGIWGWTLLIVGGVVVGLIALIGVIGKEVTKWIIIGLGSVSALGIFIFNDLHRNPLKNIGAGLWETYNTVTGLLGDVLSYLRLYALGLAGAMLGFAFNDLAKMALGDGGIGWVFFALIVIVGHTLNLAMAALGAFVHPLRLNFLEFFKNSGYEGSGRKYKPLQKYQSK